MLLGGLACVPCALSASNVYIAPTASGGATGADCGDAVAFSYFNTASNWGAGNAIAPGTNVHICAATDTAAAGANLLLQFQAPGTVGNVITLIADQGAVTLQAPYFGIGGAIVDHQNYTSIRGMGNLIIQNTANGSAQTYQQSSTGVDMGDCSNCTVDGVTVQNMYMYASYAAVTSGSWSAAGGGTATLTLSAPCPFAAGVKVYVGGITPSGYAVGNVTLSSCSGSALSYPLASNPGTYSSGGQVADEGGSNSPGQSLLDVYGIRYGTVGGNSSNFQISNSTITWCNRAIQLSVPGSQTISGTNNITGNVVGWSNHGLDFLSGNTNATLSGTNSIFANQWHDGGVWADGSVFDGNHGDYIQIGPIHTGASFGANTVFIYDNYFYGAIGANNNAFIYLTGTGLTFSGAAVFNNVMVFTDASQTPACGMICDIVQSAVIVNNTMVGSTNSTSALGSQTCIHAYDNPGQVNATIENNICGNIAIGVDIGNAGGSVAASDYNDYYNLATSGFGGVGIDNANHNYLTLALWQGCNSNGCPAGPAPTHDTNSTIGNPLLNSASVPPFRPQGGTAVYRSGANLTSLCSGTLAALCTDAAGVQRPIGSAWDTGAYQLESVLSPLNLSLAAH